MNLPVSAPDQTHIRPPRAATAPRSRLRRVRLSRTRPFFIAAVQAIRPRDSSTWIRRGRSCLGRLLLSLICSQHHSGALQNGALNYDACGHILPQRDQQLSRQRHDRRLTQATAIAFDAFREPLRQRRLGLVF